VHLLRVILERSEESRILPDAPARRPFYLDEVQRFAEDVIPAVRSK